jgi:hypothetical protein
MQLRSALFTTVVGGIMALTSVASHRADEIFKTGPETLIAQASTILAGPISNYSKHVVLLSQPESEGVALKWVISGQLENPRVLKGQAPPGAIKFSRSEQSMFLPKDPSTADWEAVYGELALNDQVVLFLADTSSESILKVLPSGDGERDLVTLINDIVSLQIIDNLEQRKRQWLFYLGHARHDEGRRAALRTLIHTPVEWTALEPILEQLMVNPQVGHNMRTFVFGIVTFAVTEEQWGASHPQAVNFLCRLFLAEQDTNFTLQYILSIKKVLRYSYDETAHSMRKPVGQQLLDCLKRRETLGSLDPPIQEQYRQIRASYPGLL